MEEMFKKIEDFELPKNMEFIKNALLQSAIKRSRRRSFAMKLVPVLGAALSIAAVGLYMNIDLNDAGSQRNELGGIWCTFDDHATGGTSSVWPPASNSCENLFEKSAPGYGDRGYAVRIKGTAGTKLGFDFLGVNAFLGERASCPYCTGIDIRRYKGIEFKIKGVVSSGSVLFIIAHEGNTPAKDNVTCLSLTDCADYETDITQSITPKWKTVRLFFKKDFKQPAWTKPEHCVSMDDVLADANLLKWLYKGGCGNPVDLWIDDVQLF